MKMFPNQTATTARLVLAAALALGACSTAASVAIDEPPITTEEIGGTGLWRLTLSASAADRLDVQTTTVEAAEGRLVVPSAAVIIDPDGIYWVYTNPEPLVFVRHQLESVEEHGLQAFFDAGPAPGTAVVTTGVPELYGAEFGIGK
jgi:hypothetical protein